MSEWQLKCIHSHTPRVVNALAEECVCVCAYSTCVWLSGSRYNRDLNPCYRPKSIKLLNPSKLQNPFKLHWIIIILLSLVGPGGHLAVESNSLSCAIWLLPCQTLAQLSTTSCTQEAQTDDMRREGCRRPFRLHRRRDPGVGTMPWKLLIFLYLLKEWR